MELGQVARGRQEPAKARYGHVARSTCYSEARIMLGKGSIGSLSLPILTTKQTC